MTQRKRTIPRQSESSDPPPQSGGGLFDQPDYDLPDIPINITDVSDDILMRLFVEFTGWQNYAATQFAEAEVEEERASARVRFLEATGMVRSFGGKTKVTEVRAEIAVEPDVVKAKDEELAAYARRKLTKVIYDNCERSVFVVSRELSRRIGAAGSERRINRWTP
jgi:hypothetical protein